MNSFMEFDSKITGITKFNEAIIVATENGAYMVDKDMNWSEIKALPENGKQLITINNVF